MDKQLGLVMRMRQDFSQISPGNIKKLVEVALGFLKQNLTGIDFYGVKGSDIHVI